MPVWPKFVYTFNGSLRTAATRRKLRGNESARADQTRTLNTLTHRLGTTSHWKAAGIEPGMTYSQFHTRIPVQTYSSLAPAFERMYAGEADVLWPGRCTLFGLTAGTSTGTPKCLPMTDDLLAHFRRAGFEAFLYYMARVGHTRALRGRHLYCSAPTEVAPLGSKDAFVGEVGGIVIEKFPAWATRHFYEPGLAPVHAPFNQESASQLARRTASRNITAILGLPNGVADFTRLLRSQPKAPQGPPQDRWRNLECLIHTGAPIAPYASELRRHLGTRVTFHDVYASAEGIIAAQDAEPARGLRVMADMGLFLEFVPLADYDSLRPEQLGTRAIPLADVKPQVDYVILVTTPGGLARYVLGDVVRFVSTKPPRFFYVGGIELRLNGFHENLTERELTDALVGLCERRQWTIVNFHVAPLFTSESMTGQRRGCHEWWVELQPGTVITPTGPQIGIELDAALREISSSYAAKRSAGIIDIPTVRLVMPGVFEHWLRFQRKWGGQHKMPRCRSDRSVADEFAQMTNFARD